MTTFLKICLCFILLFSSSVLGWKPAENTRQEVSDPIHVVPTESIYAENITIQDDSVSFDLVYIASTIIATDYTYRIENRQLIITLFEEFPVVGKEYLTNISIPVQRESYDMILLCEDYIDTIYHR